MYTKLANDAKFVYISVRPFKRTEDTRRFIDHHNMPSGPIITVPYETVDSVHAFVGGTADKLKMLFVKELQMLGYKVEAGFGNRWSDQAFYTTAKVPAQVKFFKLKINLKCL